MRNFGLAWWGKPKNFSRVTPEATGITGIRAHARQGTPEVGLVLVMPAAQAVTQLQKINAPFSSSTGRPDGYHLGITVTNLDTK